MKDLVQDGFPVVKSYIDAHDTAAKRAVEANIAPVETDAAASVGTYAIGDQLILNDVLYEATAAIDPGDALETTGAGANIQEADKIAKQIQDANGDITSLKSALTNQVKDMNNILGAKNLLPPTYTQTNAGVTYTSNDDGSITINGTRTSAGGIILNDEIVLKAGETYVYSIGNPFNLSNTAGSNIEGYDGSSWVSVGVNVYGTETIGEFTASNTYSKYRVKINANNGVVFSNLTIYPMLCLKSIYELDSTYQPYTKTNRQLTEDSIDWDDYSEVGAVNFIYPNDITKVEHGITYTLNSDNSLTLSGTPDGSASAFGYRDYEASLLAGKTVKFKANPSSQYVDSKLYVAIICRATESGSNLYRQDLQLGGSQYKDELVFTVPSGTNVILANVCMFQGATDAINITYKPMLTLASYNGPYVPYAKTNRELTADTTGLLDNLEVNGAVNMLPNNATTQTINGITFTVNDDGTVTANGTATEEIGLEIGLINELTDGTYKLTGCPSNGTLTTYYLSLYQSGIIDAVELGEGLVFNKTSVMTNTKVYLRIKNGATVSNLTCKPMITLASYNGDYVPYAKSNRELTEELEAEIGNITTLVSTSEYAIHSVKKYGDVCEATVTLKLAEAVSAWTDFIQLPSGFYPRTYTQIVAMKGDYTTTVNLQISPSTGAIQSTLALNSGDTIRFTVTYMTA